MQIHPLVDGPEAVVEEQVGNSALAEMVQILAQELPIVMWVVAEEEAMEGVQTAVRL